MRLPPRILLGALPLSQAFNLVINPKYAQVPTDTTSSVPIDLSPLRNNRGFGMSPGDADLDGRRSAYPAQFLPPANFTYAGTAFVFPQYNRTRQGYDNVLAQGQVLAVPRGRYTAVHLLAAAETAIATGTLAARYADGSTSAAPVLIDPFWDWPYPYGGDVIFPYHLTASGVDYNRSMMFHTALWLDGTRELAELRLPDVRSGVASDPGGATQRTRLHVFAATLVAAQGGAGAELAVRSARSTTAWFEGSDKVQIVEAVVDNVGTEWVLANHSVSVSVEAAGLRTVRPAVIRRLRPGDQARVQIGVVNAEGVAAGTVGPATVVVAGKERAVAAVPTQRYSFNATYGIPPYKATFDDIYRHESPPWFNDAKYGIFIHWGVYSVPGWGNTGSREAYAEWYWWNMNQGPRTRENTYQYHLQTYGRDVVYDDFIQNFTAAAFDAKAWVDLFAEAGARYFVQVSKHHDGYALFDLPASVSRRTSVALPPHRDLVRELFEAARRHQPQLHRATYFSLPEWFHPAYARIGFASWPGGNATNPYTGQKLPYTGAVAVADYVADVAAPSMRALADLGTEIMWCDIGGPNATAEFAAAYFNAAAAEGRQVLINNRCGVPGDFDTPEYARYDSVQGRKWESNLGLDPYSYGYNRATPASAYLGPRGIVTSLVDIAAKNGNFLLDVGPTADGTIIDVERRNLREAGAWIRAHAEAIFNTTYWVVTPEEGPAVRFTQTPDAFYITTLYAPNATLVLRSPVPYVPGDRVTVVGGSLAGAVVPSRLLADGRLELTVSQEVRDADKYAWVFKIPYADDGSGQPSAAARGNTGAPSSGLTSIARRIGSMARSVWGQRTGFLWWG